MNENTEEDAQAQGDDQGRTLESLVSAGGIEEQAEGQAGVGMEELPAENFDENPYKPSSGDGKHQEELLATSDRVFPTQDSIFGVAELSQT